MNSVSQAAEVTAEKLVRRLSRRYLIVLVAVAALVVVDQATIQPWLLRLNAYAPAINIAGRQRMLSQRLSKAALALQASTNPTARAKWQAELLAALDQWSQVHAMLSGHGDGLGPINLNAPQIRSQLAALEPHFQQISRSVQTIIKQDETESHAQSAAAPRPIDEILLHEGVYLSAMDKLVTLLEAEAASAVNRLRSCALAIAAAVIGLIAGLGWLVVRPATGTIRQQVDRLESTVAARTQELMTANEQLEREMNEHEQAELRTQQLSAQLAHAARVSTMGHLTAGLAHELNQPLTAIVNYCEACELELAKETQDRSKLQRHLSQASEASLRAGQIVRRMRDFVRPQVGVRVPCDLHGLVREVAELCRAELEASEVTLTLDLAASDATITVDAIQIQQVLVNLLRNAAQALQGQPPDRRRIRVQSTCLQDCIQITVADTGPGLSAELAATAFDPFQTTKSDGLGIGLSICRSIIENHHGRIWLEPATDAGATFVFTLPCRIAEASDRKPIDCVCR